MEKNREKVEIIIGSKPDFDQIAFKYFILNLNKIQNSLEFFFPETRLDFDNHYDRKSNSIDDLFENFSKIQELYFHEDDSPEPSYIINIISGSIEGNLFGVTRAKVSFITTVNWEKNSHFSPSFSPPSLFDYLYHSIIWSILRSNDFESHVHTNGCVLDYSRDKYDEKVDIILGYICSKDKKIIVEKKGEQYYSDLQQIIDRKWIGDQTRVDSVSFNLKKYFNFNIDKDSGFNKTIIDRLLGHISTVSEQIIILTIVAVVSFILGKFF